MRLIALLFFYTLQIQYRYWSRMRTIYRDLIADWFTFRSTDGLSEKLATAVFRRDSSARMF